MSGANAVSAPATPAGANPTGSTSTVRPGPVVCLLVVGSFIGITANLVKLAAAAGVAPVAFLAWSVLGAGAVLLAAAAVTRQLPPVNRRTIEYFLVSGLISIAVPNALIFSAVPHVGAGFAALSFAFPPLYTYAMALVGGLERLRAGRAAGVAFGVAGAAVLAFSKAAEPDADLFWIAATLAAPVVIGAGNIYRTVRWPAGASSMALAPGMLLGAALLLFAATPLLPVPMAPPVGDGPAALLLAAQTLTFSAMYVLFFVLQRMAGPVYLSQIGAVGAAVGATIAILALGEAPPAALGWAAVLIAIGVGLLTRAKR